MSTFHFALRDLPPEAESLRTEVREFLAEQFSGANPVKRARSWGGFDREFSRRVGERGWIGMTYPKQYGGHERTFLERYVVLEEMLAAGAPVSAHWVADRQSGPTLLRFGTEAQKQKIVPGIVRGELAFAIGMSEPDSGSDLASVRTRATKVDGGYLINGTKVWTSNAHLSDYLIALFRTHVVPDKKHEGLTQFLVDLKTTKGITIRPIIDLAGHHHFNEVNFTDAFVPDQARVGSDGDGWKQVTTELGFERSGPERYLSSIALIRELVREVPIVSHVRDLVSLIVMTTHPAFEHAPEITKRFVRYGSSPRGAQAMVLGAKVLALSEGRYNVSAEDIRAMAAPALRHRIILNFEGEAEGVDSDTIVLRAVESAERLAVREKEVFLR